MKETTYSKAVQRNLEHMGTPSHEWSASEILAITDNGVEYAHLEGYKSAPTLYVPSGSEACCELCGHPIKNCYRLQNDTRKLTLIVGSECVTHFAQANGEELVKQFELDAIRAEVAELLVAVEVAQIFDLWQSAGICYEYAHKLDPKRNPTDAQLRGWARSKAREKVLTRISQRFAARICEALA